MKKMNPKTKTKILAYLGLAGLALFVIGVIALDWWAITFIFG